MKNKKRKLRKIWNKSYYNKQKSKIEEDKFKKNKSIDFNIYNNLKKKFDFSTEWENLEIYNSNDEFSELYYCWNKQYLIEFKNIPIKILSYINIKFIYKDLTEENRLLSAVLDYPIVNYVYKINKEYENNTVDCKLEINVTLNADRNKAVWGGYIYYDFWNTRQKFLGHQIQGKLLISLINPESYT